MAITIERTSTTSKPSLTMTGSDSRNAMNVAMY